MLKVKRREADGKSPRRHDLRHLTISLLAKSGLGEQLTAAYIGYHGTEMVRCYTHIERHPDDTRAAAASLEKSFYGFFTLGEKADESKESPTPE